MLTAITFKNFRSYKEARLPLAPLTVLIGANASGKSNAIEGLRLLSWLAQGQKLSALAFSAKNGERVVRGRAEDLALSKGLSFGLGCETNFSEWNRLSMTFHRREDGLHITGESLDHLQATVPLYSIDQPPSGMGSDVGVAYNNFAKGRNKPHIACNDQQAIFTQLTSPASFDAKHVESKKRIPDIARRLERLLTAICFLDPVPARMRDYSFPSEKRIRDDGENLSGILFNLWGEEPERDSKPFSSHRQDVLAFVQSLPEQEIAAIQFLEEPRGGKMVQLVETFGGEKHEYDASLLSDGTLRVLAIAAAMLSAEAGTLVVIEEIDNGVHPSRARHLLARISEVAHRRNLRVLLSTHNPALLDALPDSAIPDVVFCYRDRKDGTSRLVRLEDVPNYPELIGQGSLGYLATSGILDRFIKFRPSEEERNTQISAWLEQLRKGDEL